MSACIRSAVSARRTFRVGSAQAQRASASVPSFSALTTVLQTSSGAPGTWRRLCEKRALSLAGDSGTRADDIIKGPLVKLPALDVAIIGIYPVSLFALAQWVSREKGA